MKRLNKVSTSSPSSVVSSPSSETASASTNTRSSELHEAATISKVESTEATVWTSVASFAGIAEDYSTEKPKKISIWDIESRLPVGKDISAIVDSDQPSLEQEEDAEDRFRGSLISADSNANESTARDDSRDRGNERGREILEASALSALLIPGGQISTSISSKPPSGRSTIIKVASPHLSRTADRDFSGNRESANSTPAVNPVDEKNVSLENDSTSSLDASSLTIIEDNPFNWYFQNYNETNIEPYVGVVYNGKGNILVSSFVVTILPFFLLAVQING